VLERLKVCHVGFLHYPREAKLIQAGLFMEGIKGISVTNMGDNLVLLESSKEGELEAVRGRKKEW
jgi:hypothetical protein